MNQTYDVYFPEKTDKERLENVERMVNDINEEIIKLQNSYIFIMRKLEKLGALHG